MGTQYIRYPTNTVSPIDPTKMAFMYDDWTASDVTGSNHWGGTNASGGGFSVSPAGTSTLDQSKHPGILDININALNSRACIDMATKNYLLGNGQMIFETCVLLTPLATATEDYIINIGLSDARTSATINNGVFFQYKRASNVNWTLNTAQGTTVNTIDSTIAVASGAWTRLKFVASADGSSVAFYINDALVGTSNAHLPVTAGSNECWPGFFMFKTASAASANADLYVDYVMVQKQFLAER